MPLDRRHGVWDRGSGSVTLRSGLRLGPYEILSPIGAGGMGEIYRARDSRLGRDVAIKVPPERLLCDKEALARFEREARAVAALTHPNILDIHDVGTADGVTFVVTELLEGESLGERLKRGPLPWRSALDIGLAIADGLAAAHGCGVVHRDLKPDNIFLSSDGRVKILDFGLAQREAEKSEDSASRTPASTATGILVGTAGYISPEQVQGKRADERSDIFALGCILYEAVTGRRAFTGDTPAETLVATLKEEPRDPADLVDVPEDVRMLILRSLAKKPERRFQSARDLAFALQAARTAARPTPVPASAPAAITVVIRPRPCAVVRRRRGAVLLFAAAALAVGRRLLRARSGREARLARRSSPCQRERRREGGVPERRPDREPHRQPLAPPGRACPRLDDRRSVQGKRAAPGGPGSWRASGPDRSDRAAGRVPGRPDRARRRPPRHAALGRPVSEDSRRGRRRGDRARGLPIPAGQSSAGRKGRARAGAARGIPRLTTCT